MRLTTGELAELPLPAQWLDAQGRQVTRTPEWQGGGLDTVQFRCGALQMVVETAARDEATAVLTERVLGELDQLAESSSGLLQLHRRGLRAALHLVMGRPDLTERSSDEVLAVLRASAAEEQVKIGVEYTRRPMVVRGGDTLAIALKQLATNAAKHDGAVEMMAEIDPAGIFRVRWRGRRSPGAVRTSRHPDERQRWGLGLVRLAADALGASVLPVRHGVDGRSEAAIEILKGGARLTLPLAAVGDDRRIVRATRAWDEETATSPGAPLPSALGQLVNATQLDEGRLVSEGAYVARRGLQTWIAVRPRSHRDQARDLIAGIAHEEALVGEGQDATLLVGSAAALNLALGSPVEMWARAAAEEELGRACSAFGAPPPSIHGDGSALPPPALMAFLASEGGGGEFAQMNGSWVFRPSTASPVLASLTREGVLSVA